MILFVVVIVGPQQNRLNAIILDLFLFMNQIYVVNRITAFGFFPGTCGEFHRIRGEYLSPVAAVERSAPKRAGAQARSGYDGIASCKYDETVVTVSNGLYNIIQNLYKYDHNLVSRMILANQNNRFGDQACCHKWTTIINMKVHSMPPWFNRRRQLIHDRTGID